ncbi:MAG: photosynthetic complex assembly protein PuhC [Pseudomonadota bacterium]
MSAIDAKPFPKGALIAAGALLGACLTLVGGHQLWRSEHPQDPYLAYAETDAETVRRVRFAGTGAGDAAYDADTGDLIGQIGPKDGFVDAVVSGLTFERRKRGLDEDAVFELVRWTDGRLSLEDLDTQIRVNLGAFGPDGKHVFMQYLEKAPTS